MRMSLPSLELGARAAWRPRPPLDRWSLLALALALAVALPVLVVFASVLLPTEGVWSHLAATVLWDYLADTALLALGVGSA